MYVCVCPVACGVWNHVSVYVALFISILTEMYMYVRVYMYGCLNISVPVSVHACACASGSLLACADRGVTVTQSSAARPPARSASRSSVFSGRHVSASLFFFRKLKMTALAPAFRSVDHFAGLNLNYCKCCWVQYGTEECDSLRTWISENCEEFLEMQIVRHAKYVGTMIGPDGHLHRWTHPEKSSSAC